MPAPVETSAVIHELAHCLDDAPPSWAQEVDAHYVAFEHAAHKHFKMLREWDAWMKDFSLGDLDWPEVSVEKRTATLEASRRVCIRRGLLTRKNNLTYRRWDA